MSNALVKLIRKRKKSKDLYFSKKSTQNASNPATLRTLGPRPKPGLKLCGAGPQSLAVMPCIRKHSVLQLSNNTSVRVVSKLGAGGFGAAYRVTKMHPVPPDSCKATATAGHGNAKPAAARGGDLVVKLQRGSCAREYYLLRLVTRRVTLGC